MGTIKYLDESDIHDKRVLMRADFDVSFNEDLTIADDVRIKNNIPTIKYLLDRNNRVICIAKLGRPKGRDPNPKYSLKVVVERLKHYFPENKITLVNDFEKDASALEKQQPNEVLVLENIRFYPEEKANDPEFAKRLAAFGDIYVNDAFAMCHRSEATTVGLPKLLPGYAGIQLKKELQMICKVIENPQKPVVAIMGGAKISTKIPVMGKLNEMADDLLVGGGIANMLLKAKGLQIGKSFIEEDSMAAAEQLTTAAAQQSTHIVLPEDAVVAPDKTSTNGVVKKVEDVTAEDAMYDIGPETQAHYGAIIAKAKTIIWNGPVGYVENPEFRRGTDFIYYSIANNHDAVSIVGGGDTLTAISKKEYLEKITHISTGGGAMLEFIEKGTLPGIEALQ